MYTMHQYALLLHDNVQFLLKKKSGPTQWYKPIKICKFLNMYNLPENEDLTSAKKYV
jgi:hypothetical protein